MFNEATFWEIFLPFVASLYILVHDKVNFLFMNTEKTSKNIFTYILYFFCIM